MHQVELQTALEHHKSGRLAEAAAMYQQLLAANPRNARALNYFGVLLIQSGQLDLAIAQLERAIAVNPKDAHYHCNLGEALRRVPRMESAIASFREALRLDPGLTVAHNNLGIAHAAMGNFEEAVASYRQAIRRAPEYAEAHANLGNALKELSRLDESIAECSAAIALKPENAEFHNQLAAALAKRGDFDEAVSEYKTAIRIDPNHADAHSNLGNALAAQGRVQDAVTSSETAVRLRPDSIGAHWNFAVALLRAGDYQRGWAEHEWRLRPQALGAGLRFAAPMWNGSPLNGRTILLHAEQGFGDTIQFARFIPMVAARGGRVIVECHPELVRLFQGCIGAERVIARGESLPPFDHHAPLMSLPLISQTRLQTVPAIVPYFQVDDLLADRWRERIASTAGDQKFHVGLCWAGNAVHRDDYARSIAVAELAPLANDGVVFHSLQKQTVPAELKKMRVVDHSAELNDFAETAALLINLDHVITVDTAVAHLSGAVGVPTSVALSSIPDWRWMLHRQDNPWYPTHRLYRQRRLGEWASVVQNVATSLRTMSTNASDRRA